MPGVDPGIHFPVGRDLWGWIAGSSPAMTKESNECVCALERSGTGRTIRTTRIARSKIRPFLAYLDPLKSTTAKSSPAYRHGSAEKGR
jgi:hypothetical protein